MTAKLKGDIYEYFIRDFIYKNEKINDISIKKKSVRLWKELSEYQLFDCGFITSYNEHRLIKKSEGNPLIDVGIDILFQDNNNNYIFVQCKNYQNTICVNDLAGFYMMMANHTNKTGIVFHSNPNISRNITYNHINKNIKYVHQPILAKNIFKNDNKIKISLYDYQKTAVKELREHFVNNNRGILNFVCGTGKTLISYVFAKSYKYIFLISPLKEFAQQNLTRYIQYGSDTFIPILIDSDGIRDLNELTKYLDKKVVFSATYKSCDLVYELLKLLNPDDVMIIIDEFHNLSYNNVYGNFIQKNKKEKEKESENEDEEENESENDKNEDESDDNDDKDENEEESDNENNSDKENEERENDNEESEDEESDSEESDNENEERENDEESKEEKDDKINIDPIFNILSSNFKILFMSATPRIYTLEDNEDDDIENILGKIVCKMSIKEAIENKYITDYKIYLPVFDDKDIINDIEKELNNKIKEFEFVNKCLFMFEAIKKFGNLKCIIYLQSHNEIKLFSECFKKLNEYFNYEFFIDNITCNDNQKERKLKIKNFSEINNKPSFLLSVSILDECIDIKKCDSIFITYNSSNKIKNIQRLFRTTRLDGNNENKFGKIFVWMDENNENVEFISSIKEYDENFINKVRYLGCSNKFKTKTERKEINKKMIEKNKVKLIGIKEYRAQNWHTKLELVKNFIKQNKKRPNKHSENKNEKEIGMWLNSQLKNYKKRTEIMKYDNIHCKFTSFLNNNKEIFKSNEEIWQENFYKLCDFIKTNKKRPSRQSKNNDEKEIRTWLDHQLINYKRRTEIMKDDNIRDKFGDFLNKNKELFKSNGEIWQEKFNKLLNYIKTNKKRPNKRSKNNDEKEIGLWLSNQLQNYKNKKEIMKNDNIYQKFADFLNGNKNLFSNNI